MDSITVRRATAADAPAIHGLNRDELGYLYELDKTRARLAQLASRHDHCILVAVRDGQVAGYLHATGYDTLYYDPLVDILALAVRSDHRRRGVGRLLMQGVENWAREQGAAGVRLVSRQSRTGAHSFYLACGYTLNKTQVNFAKLLS